LFGAQLLTKGTGLAVSYRVERMRALAPEVRFYSVSEKGLTQRLKLSVVLYLWHE
jgi:hypothetical protein